MLHSGRGLRLGSWGQHSGSARCRTGTATVFYLGLELRFVASGQHSAMAPHCQCSRTRVRRVRSGSVRCRTVFHLGLVVRFVSSGQYSGPAPHC